MATDIRDTSALDLVTEKKFVVTCSPEATLEEALEAMKDVNVSGLPVFSPVRIALLLQIHSLFVFAFSWIFARALSRGGRATLFRRHLAVASY